MGAHAQKIGYTHRNTHTHTHSGVRSVGRGADQWRPLTGWSPQQKSGLLWDPNYCSTIPTSNTHTHTHTHKQTDIRTLSCRHEAEHMHINNTKSTMSIGKL